MKFKTLVEQQEVQIETVLNPSYVPFRAEEIPSKELLEEINAKIISYYQLFIRIGENEFYSDGVLLANDQEEHQEELEEYIDQEDLIEIALDYLSLSD